MSTDMSLPLVVVQSS